VILQVASFKLRGKRIFAMRRCIIISNCRVVRNQSDDRSGYYR